MDILNQITQEFKLREDHVKNIVELLDEGNTIPFIARYRKEMTGHIDDQVLRELSDRLTYLRNIEKRKEEVSKSITEQGKMTDEIAASLTAAETLAEVEDIYRPYKQKRKTRATVAIAKGLEPLADIIYAQNVTEGTVEDLAKPFVNEELGIASVKEAIAGAEDIIAERISDEAELRKKLRKIYLKNGEISSKIQKAEEDGAKTYEMYADYSEPVSEIKSHRVLALNRGEEEGYLKVKVAIDEEFAVRVCEVGIVKEGSVTTPCVKAAVADAYKRLIQPSIEREIRNYLTENAQEQAIKMFDVNLRPLLMQPPVKDKVTMGFDPAYRTGCKIAVVDGTGKVLDTTVVYPTPPQSKTAEAKAALEKLIDKYSVDVISIGNGTASKESEIFVADMLKDYGGKVGYVVVNEAGASVYSGSPLAAKEFPQYDLTLRSAISIARRLQDPLAELIKIDPKAIGVGQYQHDLKQNELTAALDGVVEHCVNSVGVELSTASAELLSHVAGIGPALAKNIVAYRDENGLPSRAALKKVPKLGPRAYEQCAGFLRVQGSKNPLDATAVHPESYDAAKALLRALDITADELKKGGIPGILEKARAYGLEKLAGETGLGLPTLQDILAELQKPGRDPREDLPQPILRTDVLDIKDLKPGMELMGTVRNVIDFGAFVDIGVHQDGLVHISRMSNRFIRHPSEVVKVGDVITVWVVDVDLKKQRIGLSMLPPAQK